MEENSRLKGSCFAAGDVYQAIDSPVRRIIASGLVLWLLLQHRRHLSAFMIEDPLMYAVCWTHPACQPTAPIELC